jgi:hypothetical protein
MKTVQLDFKLNHKSFQHNAAQIRKILVQCGDSTVVLGSVMISKLQWPTLG